MTGRASRRDAGRPTPGRRRRLAPAGAFLLVLAGGLAGCSGTASPGDAQAGTWPPDVRHADLLRAAQRLAQHDLRGLWGVAP